MTKILLVKPEENLTWYLDALTDPKIRNYPEPYKLLRLAQEAIAKAASNLSCS